MLGDTSASACLDTIGSHLTNDKGWEGVTDVIGSLPTGLERTAGERWLQDKDRLAPTRLFLNEGSG